MSIETQPEHKRFLITGEPTVICLLAFGLRWEMTEIGEMATVLKDRVHLSNEGDNSCLHDSTHLLANREDGKSQVSNGR